MSMVAGWRTVISKSTPSTMKACLKNLLFFPVDGTLKDLLKTDFADVS